MKICSKCKTNKALEEYNKSLSSKDGYQSKCRKCCKLHRKENKDRISKVNKTWRAVNKDRHKELTDTWRDSNKEEYTRYQREWRENNRGRRASYIAKYRAQKLKATPEWLSDEQELEIKRIYGNCPIDCHVDHIVPLQSNNVCGLHVPWNLQILEAKDNLSKGNRLDVLT